MFAKFYSSEWISPERFDTDFYDPDAIVALQKIYDFPNYETFGSSGDVWGFGAYELCNAIVESELNDSPGFIKIKDINSPFINEEKVIRVTQSSHSLLKAAHVQCGDIIVSIAGTIGSSAIIPSSKVKYSANQALVKYRANDLLFDHYYVLSFTLSSHFKKIAKREAGGAVQKNLYLFNFERMPIPKPSELAQKYIGDKVRQAERLRAWARELVSQVDAELDKLALPIHKKPSLYSYSNKGLLDDRLDPRPYRSNVVELVSQILAIPHDTMSTLVVFSSGCPVKSSDFCENQFDVPLVRIRNIGVKGFIGLDTGVKERVYTDTFNYQAKQNMVVLGMDGHFRAQYFVQEDLPMLVNQRVAMLLPKGIRSELLTHWLNRSEGQLQLNQWAVKTTVEHTSLTDIAKVLIPRLEENRENELANKLLNARYSQILVSKLTQLAKLLVEDLIEGQLKEEQLVAAYQVREGGDYQLDHALLARMTTKGIDGDGTALFDDLEQLEDLLQQAELAMQEV